ncbi:hypothetical protein ISS07_02560 [Candidatus Woesearchaeota archaeon]|nr:hypothetical protein [Candidatus Woesearchaeota archaeon]
MIDPNQIFLISGFLFASYSVVANDTIQTLGTFIASNSRFKWYYLWLAASLVFVFALGYGWVVHDGDISYNRLDEIPYTGEFKWYHAAGPLVLVGLTTLGIPVSTTFLVLSVFASSVVLEKILLKSFVGYGLAAVVAYMLWVVLSKYINEHLPVKKSQEKGWMVGQWITTGFLWFTWLTHNTANFAVFLPRDLPFPLLLMTMGVGVAGLGYIFKHKGGKIQKIVLNKSNVRYVRSATIIDFVYALILFYFKEMNSIPMSTTFVFIGLLSGRELAIYHQHKDKHIKTVFPIIAKDFFKMMIGLAASIAIVVGIRFL